MRTDLITARADEDQEVVVQICRKYDLAAVPVVDDQGRLLGRITADDLMDAADEEAAEDLYRMAGTDPAELESASSLRAARIRGLWLLPCFTVTLLLAGIVQFFEARFATEVKVLVLAFMPVIAAMGGNTGIQTSTRIVRALATGGDPESRLNRAVTREAPIALVLALCFGLLATIAGSAFGYYYYHGALRLGFAVGVGMTSAIVVSATLGVGLPFLFRRIGVDPAIASGPIITSSNDIISVAIYLTAAAALV
jgi:magnesium transporter